mgnify:CR=1 FL=1
MAELRTYVLTSGTSVTSSIQRLADGRIRVNWRTGSTLKASEILSPAEAKALVQQLQKEIGVNVTPAQASAKLPVLNATTKITVV